MKTVLDYKEILFSLSKREDCLDLSMNEEKLLKKLNMWYDKEINDKFRNI